MDHHYVPKFYVGSWSRTDGRVLRYSRTPNGLVKEKPVWPRGTGYEPNLYSVPHATDWETHDPNIIESDVMSAIDNGAAAVLARLLRCEHPDPNERRRWALFLNSLRFRHRDEILERDRAAPEMARQTAEALLERTDPGSRHGVEAVLSRVEMVEMAKNAHRSLMVSAIRDPAALDAIERQAWELVVVRPDQPLITTDRPLLVNLGMDASFSLMTLPLSPTSLFVAYSPYWREDNGAKIDGVDELLDLIASIHDLLLVERQPCRFIYSSVPLDDEFLVGGKLVRMNKVMQHCLERWATLSTSRGV